MKKIDKVMNDLKEKGHLSIGNCDGSFLVNGLSSREDVISNNCPENFGLLDSDLCSSSYNCEECWNDEVEIEGEELTPSFKIICSQCGSEIIFEDEQLTEQTDIIAVSESFSGEIAIACRNEKCQNKVEIW